MSVQFKKAVRKNAKLRLAIAGPAGSGKTTAALKLAAGLGGKIAVIDTEHGSASIYSDLVDFDTLEISPPYNPEKFIEAVRAAEAAGYETIILDSITHEWNGSGGCCDINEQLAQAKYRGNTWSAWSETTPRHRKFIDTLLQSPCNIIATMRSKTETVQGDDKKVRKVGMKSEQRDGTDYEFSVVFELEHSAHMAVATKDRTRLFATPAIVTEDTGRQLLAWLNSGVTVTMTEGEIAEHEAAMKAAGSALELQAAFAQAYTAAKNINDTAAIAKITSIKDAEKARVTA
jgi:DNA polymerase III delta prime subunit